VHSVAYPAQKRQASNYGATMEKLNEPVRQNIKALLAVDVDEESQTDIRSQKTGPIHMKP
jgi:hypothetical protein